MQLCLYIWHLLNGRFFPRKRRGKNNVNYKEVDIEQIKSEININTNLKELAKKYGISYPTLLSKFREEYKTTVKQFLSHEGNNS